MKKLFLTFLLFTLTSCGFHFSGNNEAISSLGLNNVYVKGEIAYSAYAVAIKQALRNMNVSVSGNPDQAEYILNILSERENNRVEGAKATQSTRKYVLKSSMTFSISDASGHDIYGPKSISSSEALYVYSGQVLGSNQEANAVFKSLRKENASKAITMLSSGDAKAAFDSYHAAG